MMKAEEEIPEAGETRGENDQITRLADAPTTFDELAEMVELEKLMASACGSLKQPLGTSENPVQQRADIPCGNPQGDGHARRAQAWFALLSRPNVVSNERADKWTLQAGAQAFVTTTIRTSGQRVTVGINADQTGHDRYFRRTTRGRFELGRLAVIKCLRRVSGAPDFDHVIARQHLNA
ncbi:hypothetical protein TTRE_0000334401 [Trichuris trichiura]|uniref:Uncharacterized protein n=1 Tax=Trichuris trichiura TaxID=36087 RepID=A0A077Z5Y6_TRITR|nr:hypothetical protein TTRE_0000334401 [Trichuris trichiura]